MNGQLDLKSIGDDGKSSCAEENLNENQMINCPTRSVSCPFCDEQFSSSKGIEEHLMMCGNKTDLCPKCRQYVRRAIFAYHYENNCSQPDEDIVSAKPFSVGSETSLTLDQRDSLQLSTESDMSNTRDNHHSSTTMPDNRLSSQPQLNNKPIIIKCSFCGQNCEQVDLKIHKQTCLQNPANFTHTQQHPIIEDSKQNSADRSPVQKPNRTFLIRCESCHEPIQLSYYNDHMTVCREQNEQRISDEARISNEEPVAPCEYCQMFCPLYDLNIHQMDCTENPRNITEASSIAHKHRPSTTRYQSNPSAN